MKSLKLSLLLLCLMLMTSQLSAQKKFLRLANEAIDVLDYNEAVTQFRKALSKNEESSEAIVGLARAYSQLNKFSQAEFYYEKAIKSGDIENEDILDFAMNLLKNKSYDKAKKWFSSYNNSNADDSRAANYIMAINDLENLMANEAGYKIDPIASNGYGNEISPAFLDDRLVFSSDRDNDNERYNVFSINTASDAKALPILHKMNVDESETSIHFAADGKSAFITNGFVHHSRANKSKVFGTDASIWSAKLETGSWNEMNSLGVNRQGYYFTDPFLSADGNSLYFASDVPGGIGGMDIYVIYKDGDGWSDPINLGEQVNTPGHERYPFIDILGKLYFSSDGLGGFGGLDVFTAEYEGSDWKKALNLGAPINSEFDDMGMIMATDLSHGYFSSNRKGKGKHDIYRVTSGNQAVQISELAGVITDRMNSEPIEGVKMKITKNGILVNTTVTDSEGKYAFNLAEEGDYKVAAFKLGYKIQDFEIAVSSEAIEAKDLTLLPFDEPSVVVNENVNKELSDEDVLAINSGKEMDAESEEDELLNAIQVVQESKEKLAETEVVEIGKQEIEIKKEEIVAEEKETTIVRTVVDETDKVVLEEAQVEDVTIVEEVADVIVEEKEETGGWRSRRNKEKVESEPEVKVTSSAKEIEAVKEDVVEPIMEKEEVIEETIVQTETIVETETIKAEPENSKSADDYFKVKDEENTVFITPDKNRDIPEKKIEEREIEVAEEIATEKNDEIDIISQVISETIEKEESASVQESVELPSTQTFPINETPEEIVSEIEVTEEIPMAKTYPVPGEVKVVEDLVSVEKPSIEVPSSTNTLPMAKTYPITESVESTVNTWTPETTTTYSGTVVTPSSSTFISESGSTVVYDSAPTYVTDASTTYNSTTTYTSEKQYKDYPSGNWTPPTTPMNSGSFTPVATTSVDASYTSAPTLNAGTGIDLVYKVQVGAFSKQKSVADNYFSSAGSVEEEYSADGLYKYVTGYFTSMKEANNFRRQLSKSGFKGAFVVPYQYGSRISLDEAWRIIKGK